MLETIPVVCRHPHAWLVCYESDLNGMIWVPRITGITDASHGLDASWNGAVPLPYPIVASYVNVNLHATVALEALGGWVINYFDSPVGDTTAISAYEGTIFVVYEYQVAADNTIKYYISYDNGANWFWWYVADTGNNWSPDVTARRGGGIAVTWNEEAGAWDPCWYRTRTYTAPGIWETPVVYNEIDAQTGSDMSIEWVPSAPGSNIDHGTCWIEGFSGNYFALFDRTAFTLMVVPDPLVGGANATFRVTNGAPNMMTFLGYSLAGPGMVYIAPLNVWMSIAAPVQAGGPILTDAFGNGSWTLPVPAAAVGLNVWFQAVQMGSNASNVVDTVVI